MSVAVNEPERDGWRLPNLLVLPPGSTSALLVAFGKAGTQSYGPIDACGGALAVSPLEPTHFRL